MDNYMIFVWVIFAVFMLICEAMTTQLVSIWFVIGSVAAAVACLFTNDILIQSAVFVVVSLAALIATRPLVKKVLKKRKTEPTNSDRLIGRVGIVTEDIDNKHGVGTVNIDGKVWSAKSFNESEIKTGANVKIMSIEGVKLVVEIV